jgi:bifunctional non-homologous end joining protein LigD
VGSAKAIDWVACPVVPPGKRQQIEIDGKALSLSNLDKVFYPEVGFSKGQVIEYYTRVAPALLPHLRGRPLTLKRYPNGVNGAHFYEKQRPSHAPDWVRSVPLEAGDRRIDFVLADDLVTLVWLANLADLELHTSLALAERYDSPTMIAFDLDPGPPATIVECSEVALMLRELLGRLGLEAWPKSSGSKGMQVYVPLNTPISYDETKPFAHAIAQLLERREPKLVVSEMKKTLRRGRVFVDWSQNTRHKTTVCVYSLRARDRPTVSTPLRWEEVEAATESRNPEDLAFTSDDVLARVVEHRDLFAPVLSLRQELPAVAA